MRNHQMHCTSIHVSTSLSVFTSSLMGMPDHHWRLLHHHWRLLMLHVLHRSRLLHILHRRLLRRRLLQDGLLLLARARARARAAPRRAARAAPRRAAGAAPRRAARAALVVAVAVAIAVTLIVAAAPVIVVIVAVIVHVAPVNVATSTTLVRRPATTTPSVATTITVDRLMEGLVGLLQLRHLLLHLLHQLQHHRLLTNRRINFGSGLATRPALTINLSKHTHVEKCVR